MALPVYIDPRRLAMQNTELEGDVPIQCLARLASIVVSIDKHAKAIIRFSIDESELATAVGNVSITLNVQCQRCLDSVKLDIYSEFALKVTNPDDEYYSEKSGFESWFIEQQNVNLHDMLEDELILALPIVSYHKLGKCTGYKYVPSRDSVDTNTTRPFDILKRLKTNASQI